MASSSEVSDDLNSSHIPEESRLILNEVSSSPVLEESKHLLNVRTELNLLLYRYKFGDTGAKEILDSFVKDLETFKKCKSTVYKFNIKNIDPNRGY
jgi:hypothetical protein